MRATERQFVGREVAFQFPVDSPGAQVLTDLVREAVNVLKLEGVTGPYTVTVTVEGDNGE